VAKFYLRIHKNLKNKYKLIIDDGDGFRILSTCIRLALNIYQKDNLASFGYIGENKIGESKNKTQRYRVYSMISKRDFSPKKFEHLKDEKNSIYFLLNKKNSEINKELVTENLLEYIQIFSLDT